ncbi:MAG: MurR/RpiR family transcriptional regulator [Anaerolineales bacterium]|nr:MAG: MurR/RpiR family transcriptional regulator [Anaerolineales bacterium]
MNPEETRPQKPTSSLDERITEFHHKLSPKHKRLARFVLDNKYFMSFASASQAGKKTGTSAATVVRFAQTLGYDGYSELQFAIRAELPSYLTAVERMQARLEAPPPPDNIPHKVFYTDINNIERTANNLDEHKLEGAVEAIVSAKRILVVGAGLSASPALFLAHSLKIIGFDARVNLNEGLSLAAETAQLSDSTLIIAIDLWRYVHSTIKAVEFAKKRGARSIAITDSTVSPLARMADFAFEVVTDGVSHSLSTTGVMSLLNVLIATLSNRAPNQTITSLRSVDRAYRDNNLLIVD